MTSSTGRRLAWFPRRAQTRGRAALRLGRMWWRRSLLMRVVAATVVLGLLVVLVVGQYLLQRISDGLVDSRTASALNEADQIAQQVRTDYHGSNITDASTLNQFVSNEISLHEGPRGDASTRYLVLIKALSSDSSPVPGRASREISQGAGAIPMSLRHAVNDNPSRSQSQIFQLHLDPTPNTTGTVRAIAVGTTVDLGLTGGGRWELYTIFRLDREVQILDLVRRTFVAGGIALVLLVGAVAWVVTRQVVAPVRQAARTAEQLASGRLDRRMRVRGEDDLARLAGAFNAMAAGLERQIHQLEELSRVQRRFVSDVSHELRTPLTTIRMAGEVMYEARHQFDPAVARSAELLQAQLDRFEALLADLLEISRFDAGAAVLDVEPGDVREIVARVVDGLTPLADRRGVPLAVHTPRVPCMAEIDPRRVERIVRNLVGNAIEHGEARTVDVTVASDADAVVVCVRDHGVGLRPADLRMVFSRFWRADPARARATGGTGLGLAIALEDAHLHGGWLQAWGEPGQGANFRLTLPRRPDVVLSTSPLPLVPRDAAVTAEGALGVTTLSLTLEEHSGG